MIKKFERNQLSTITLKSWWYVCPSNEIPSGQTRTVHIGSLDLVLFRSESGQLAALDLHCSHMGANLSRGHVLGECLQCPFHHWEYSKEGKCIHIPASRIIPKFAKVKSYPIEERNGLIFIFNSSKALFDLPFFKGHKPEEFIVATFRLEGDFPWYFISANAFDVQHLEYVHERHTIEPSQIDYPSLYSCHILHKYQIKGTDWVDRLLRILGGNKVELSFTSWCGNMILAIATFPKFKSYMIFFVEPLGSNRSAVNFLVYAPQPGWDIWLRRYFTLKFFIHEFQTIRNTQFNPNTLIKKDATFAEYMRWLESVKK